MTHGKKGTSENGLSNPFPILLVHLRWIGLAYLRNIKAMCFFKTGKQDGAAWKISP